MLYQFMCKKCEHPQEEVFPMSEYDEHVEEDGLLKDVECEKCGTKDLYRHITKAPTVKGGTTGYKSMESWWADNPGHVRKMEDQIQTKKEERHRKRVLDRIDKQRRGLDNNNND